MLSLETVELRGGIPNELVRDETCSAITSLHNINVYTFLYHKEQS